VPIPKERHPQQAPAPSPRRPESNLGGPFLTVPGGSGAALWASRPAAPTRVRPCPARAVSAKLDEANAAPAPNSCPSSSFPDQPGYHPPQYLPWPKAGRR